MKTNIFTTFLFSLVLLPFLTIAQENIEVKQLAKIEVLLESMGYSRTHSYMQGSLNKGESDYFYFTLDSGKKYSIVSTCDSDCSDIDLWLYDENDNEIDSDYSNDDKPVVECSPKWTGLFKLKIRMVKCSINPCKFIIAIYGNEN